MFIIELTYKKELSEVEKFLENHKNFLDKNYEKKKFLCSGRKEPRTGGVILSNLLNRKEVEEIIQKDPFFINDIAKYNIIEFYPSKYLEEFSNCIN